MFLLALLAIGCQLQESIAPSQKSDNSGTSTNTNSGISYQFATEVTPTDMDQLQNILSNVKVQLLYTNVVHIEFTNDPNLGEEVWILYTNADVLRTTGCFVSNFDAINNPQYPSAFELVFGNTQFPQPEVFSNYNLNYNFNYTYRTIIRPGSDFDVQYIPSFRSNTVHILPWICSNITPIDNHADLEIITNVYFPLFETYRRWKLVLVTSPLYPQRGAYLMFYTSEYKYDLSSPIMVSGTPPFYMHLVRDWTGQLNPVGTQFYNTPQMAFSYTKDLNFTTKPWRKTFSLNGFSMPQQAAWFLNMNQSKYDLVISPITKAGRLEGTYDGYKIESYIPYVPYYSRFIENRNGFVGQADVVLVTNSNVVYCFIVINRVRPTTAYLVRDPIPTSLLLNYSSITNQNRPYPDSHGRILQRWFWNYPMYVTTNLFYDKIDLLTPQTLSNYTYLYVADQNPNCPRVMLLSCFISSASAYPVVGRLQLSDNSTVPALIANGHGSIKANYRIYADDDVAGIYGVYDYLIYVPEEFYNMVISKL